MDLHPKPELIRPGLTRTAPDIASRALAVFTVFAVATGADRDEVLPWLEEAGLEGELTAWERSFLDPATTVTEQMIVDASWLSERLIVLLWALGAADLPPVDAQCDAAAFEILPPFTDMPVADFIDQATRRPDEELVALAGTMFAQHAEGVAARTQGRAPRTPVDLEVIQERRRAANWLIGLDNASWDDVGTDT